MTSNYSNTLQKGGVRMEHTFVNYDSNESYVDLSMVEPNIEMLVYGQMAHMHPAMLDALDNYQVDYN